MGVVLSNGNTMKRFFVIALCLLALSAFINVSTQPTGSGNPKKLTDRRIDAAIAHTFGTSGVSNTFNAVHSYLSEVSAAQLAADGVIQLGDYIDLPGITVDGAKVTDKELNGHGRLLRLIVVGINSFNASGAYTGNGNGTQPHIVFQFQNLPFTHKMEATATSTNGYAGSEMRAYITGKFLNGLIAAGVPGSILWAPTRYVANKVKDANGAHTIQDNLWLPTEREIFGRRIFSVETHETAANQARLEYYIGAESKIKYSASNSDSWYWLASPDSVSNSPFCFTSEHGGAGAVLASSVGGCAPAFCVK
jgi:hypothetical protein